MSFCLFYVLRHKMHDRNFPLELSTGIRDSQKIFQSFNNRMVCVWIEEGMDTKFSAIY